MHNFLRHWLLVSMVATVLLKGGRSAGEPGAGTAAMSDTSCAKPRAMVGAYYFDGWTASHDHINKVLYAEYAERQPVWGWKDDTIEIMRKQIDCCADVGIGFWAFDWYYPEGKNKQHPCNNALGLYLRAPNRRRLEFCLLVANHEGFRIGPNDWDACCHTWIELFRQREYLTLNGKPLLIIFAPWEMERSFGSADGVRGALDLLRAKATEAGLPGVAVAACAEPREDLNNLVRSGYTLLTGYNYIGGGIGRKPFRSLMEANTKILDEFARVTPLPYVPVITTGWDCRAFERDRTPAKRSPWYADRSPQLVEETVRNGMRWLDRYPGKTTPQRLILLYAWNENGEGGYLTPTKADGMDYLKAVRRAVLVSSVVGGHAE
jgi:hypothetical protein